MGCYRGACLKKVVYSLLLEGWEEKKAKENEREGRRGQTGYKRNKGERAHVRHLWPLSSLIKAV